MVNVRRLIAGCVGVVDGESVLGFRGELLVCAGRLQFGAAPERSLAGSSLADSLLQLVAVHAARANPG